MSIHVRRFLSLADWKSLLNPLIIPALKVYLLSQRQMTNATCFFTISSQFRLLPLPFWTTITIFFVGCNKDWAFFFSKKRTELEVCYTLLHASSITGAFHLFFHITHEGIHDHRPLAVGYYINSACPRVSGPPWRPLLCSNLNPDEARGSWPDCWGRLKPPWYELVILSEGPTDLRHCTSRHCQQLTTTQSHTRTQRPTTSHNFIRATGCTNPHFTNICRDKI